MTTKFVTFDQFDPNKLSGSEPIPKQITKPNETINYNDIKLSYNYGTLTDPVIGDFFLELPEVSARGLVTKSEEANGRNGPYTKTTHSMMLVLMCQTKRLVLLWISLNKYIVVVLKSSELIR